MRPLYIRVNNTFKILAIAPEAQVEKIADDLMWSEGPLWDSRSKTLLFSDIPRNLVKQWHAEKGVSVFLERSGYTGAAPFTRIVSRLRGHGRPSTAVQGRRCWWHCPPMRK